MRLFVAIEIAPNIRAKIDDFVSRVKPRMTNAKWARPEGMHITLKFLGNVIDDQRAAIEKALRGIDSEGFPVSIGDVGIFPNLRSPRVLWAGVEAGPELAKLAARVEDALLPLGFEREQRSYSPHVTLARFNDRKTNADASSALSEPKPSFGTMTAAEFHLYESKSSPHGSRYNKLASFALR